MSTAKSLNLQHGHSQDTWRQPQANKGQIEIEFLNTPFWTPKDFELQKI